jgi:uncharacterized protein (TIGR03382 family)
MPARRQNRFGLPVSLVVVATLVPLSALAHFVLEAPACWMSQDIGGAPLKMGPCGDEGGGTPTNVVTPFHPGDTVTITVNEIIFHPGHYRVALSVNDRSELPAEPAVVAGNNTPCGTAAIESPAVFPVLADDMLDHSTQFSSPQTFQVTLPTNVTCTKCTLQIIEFMSEHPLNNPGGCFYHHCADISIQPASGDGGFEGDGGGATPAHGCGCSTSAGATTTLGLLAASLWLRRRRGVDEC